MLLPRIANKWLWLFVFIATLAGVIADLAFGNKIDYWIHDIALVYQPRTEWKYTGIVVLDNSVPTQVSRKQALPLFARATEKLIAAGVKGVFLDAEIPKEQEGMMPYAVCIETDGQVRWSRPSCQVSSENQCQVLGSSAGNAPLKMAGEVFPYFRIAPYLGDSDLPDFLLYDMDVDANMPSGGLVALDRLVTKGATIDRWMDLSETHAAVTLANFIDPARISQSLTTEVREICNDDYPCRRLRLSFPYYDVQWSMNRPIFPVSQLAACDSDAAAALAARLKDRVIILQLTSPTEATDITITPMTTAMWGPNLLTPGPQYLADAVETLLNNDHPLAPAQWVNDILFLLAAMLGVRVSAYHRQQWAWLTGCLLLILLCSLCIFLKQLQLWPVTVTMLTFAAGALQTMAMHLLIGLKEGKLVAQYMPKQVHELLMSLKADETFQHQRYYAVVLMSDLAGYTRVTSMLKEPVLVLELMNDYLNETSFVLQDQFDGWLETYIGDMVCYYWPYKDGQQITPYRNAIRGAVALSQLQKRFFSAVSERYRDKFDAETLSNISTIINAGIGVSSGPVVMGNLGPKRGVRKFGILGDPMNLTSRVEALTRFFNTEIIISHEFASVATSLGLPVRRLGNFCVKGRDGQPEMLYALGAVDDNRFQPQVIAQWEAWLCAEEIGLPHNMPYPEIFTQDQAALRKWTARGLLHGGIWNLEEK